MVNQHMRRALVVIVTGAVLPAITWAQLGTMQTSTDLQTSRPMFLSGEVVISDGTPLPKPVRIDMVCQGQSQPQGYTDADGGFGFMIGQNRNTTPEDASQRSVAIESSFGGFVDGSGQTLGTAEYSLIGCGLRAILEGYSSSVIELSLRRAADSPEVGQIVLTRLGETEGTVVSLTSLSAPREAARAYERGVQQIGSGRFEQAEAQLSRAVEIYPDYAEAWHEMGVAHYRQEEMEEARQSFEKAVEIDPKFVKPYIHLSLLASRARDWLEAAVQSDRLLQLDPYNYAEAYYYNAVAYYNLRNFIQAVASAQKAVELDIDHEIPLAEQLLAVLLEASGDFEGAAEHMRGFIQHAPPGANLEDAKVRLASIESRLEAETEEER